MTSQVDYGWTLSELDLTDAYLLEPIATLLPPLFMDRAGQALDQELSIEAMVHPYSLPRVWPVAAHAPLACTVVLFQRASQ